MCLIAALCLSHYYKSELSNFSAGQWAYNNANNTNYDPGILMYSAALTVFLSNTREERDLHEASVGQKMISLVSLRPSGVQIM